MPSTLRISLGIYDIIVSCVYRFPSRSFNQFFHLLNLMLLFHMCKPRSEFIFCGDRNVNFLMDSNQKMKASSLLQSYNMFNVIDFPTRICDESISADDSIFLDGSRINLLAVAPIFNSLCDHEVQYLVLDYILVNDKSTLAHLNVTYKYKYSEKFYWCIKK